MKKILLFFVAIYTFGNLQAQVDCEPDPSVPDTVIISPLPYNEETTPDGGIPDSAQVDEYFEFTFTVNVPETFNYNGFDVQLDSVVFETEGAITYEPTLSNFEYTCNPPNCVYEGGTTGCLVIHGTPVAGEGGDHLATFVGAIWILFAGSPVPVPITYPDPNNPIFPPGEYILYVDPVSGAIDLNQFFSIQNQPNPFSDWTQIKMNALISGTFDFRVFDMLGKQVFADRINIIEGENNVMFDGSQLPNGMYTYTLSDGKSSLARKMVVNRR